MNLFQSIRSRLGFAAAAPAPTPAPPPADLPPPLPEREAGAFFRLGEIYKQNTAWLSLHTNAGVVSALVEELRGQARRTHAPAAVIDDIDRYEQAVLPLPWYQPWAAWNDADQQTWNAATPYSARWGEWLTAPPRDRYFFYMLGRLSNKGWSELGTSFNEDGNSAASLAPTVMDLLGTFAMMLNDAFFTHARATLGAAVLRTLEDLASLKSRVEAAPDGTGVTPEVIARIGAASRQLRDEAHADRLTQA